MNNISFLLFAGTLILGIQGLSLKNEHSIKLSLNQQAPGRTKCIDELGCFNIDGAFHHSIYRPVNLYPFDREFINVRFRIYTKGDGKKYQLLPAYKVTSTNVSKINIDPKLETKIVVHGWIDNQLVGEWMKEYAEEYFKIGNYNFVIVDWSGGNAPPYTQAVANTRVVGAEIALLINTLKNKKGLDPRKVHIIGHSLGGQIVGYAGERIKNLGRITSLDPAEPFYQYMPTEVRIDPTDAEFVEVIHSDSKSILLAGLGMNQLAGHVDFFPNNGRDQPGCLKDKMFSIFTDLIDGLRNIAACDHIRAVKYFQESIASKCQMVHYACLDYETYLAGKCADCGAKGDKCAILGERSIEYASNKNDSKPVKMYAKTYNAAPYCVYQYQVHVKFEAGAKKDQKGNLFLKLRGTIRDEEFQLGSSGQNIYPGSQYTYLITTPKDLGSITGLTFRWKSSSLLSWLNLTKPKVYLEHIKVTPMNEINAKKRELEKRQICAKKGEGIAEDAFATFKTFTNKC